MSDFDPKAMDKAADYASEELETIREGHPEGVQAVEEWMIKWIPSAGYKRLGKVLADRWN
ncbi:hypothetical protein ACFLWK_00785 [Chloroflexota bacterium]